MTTPAYLHGPFRSGTGGPAQPTAVPRWHTVLLCLLVVLVYLPALLRAEFLNFDDPLFFGPDNAAFRDDGLAAVLDPRRTIANVYLPVSHLSLYLDWRLFGSDPLGPHLVSLLLHWLGGVALVRWLLAMGVGRVAGHAVGLVFLLHPALTESVAWVSSRKDLLAGLFSFLALGQTVRFCRDPGWLRLAGIAGLGVLALYSKATAVVLPVLALLLCCYLRDLPRRRFLAPMALAAVAAPIAWHHRLLAAAEGTLSPGSLMERLPRAPGAFLHYLQTAVLPTHLNVLYPEVATFAAFRAALLPGLLVLGVLLVAGHFLWRSRLRLSALGVLLLLAALLPFNTAWPASDVAAADRYLHLALPGAALAVVGLGPVGTGLALAAVLPLGLLTFQRTEVFASSESLWRASLAAAPRNAVARLNLAADLQRRRPAELAERQELLEQAARDADYPDRPGLARYAVHRLRAERALLALALHEARYEAAARHALAVVAAAERLPDTAAAREVLLGARLDAFQPLQLAGRPAEAEAQLQRAEELAPGAAPVVAMRALQWRDQAVADGLPVAASHPLAQRAAAALDAALQDWPDDPLLNRAAGAWQHARGNRLAALGHFRRAMAGAASGDIEPWVNAAELCIGAGVEDALPEEAERYAREGLLRRPDEPRLRQLLALALAGQNRLDDAIVHMEAYVRLRPRDRNAARVLSNLLIGKAIAGMGTRSNQELEALVERALHWNPDEPKADIVRGRLCRDRRQWEQALEHLERAARNFPDYDDVLRMRAETWSDLGYQRRFAGDRDGAADAWLQFLATAPAEMPTEAARMMLQAESRHVESAGVRLLEQGDRSGAEQRFRRALQLDPRSHSAAWFLAAAVAAAPDADFAEVDRLLERAIAGRREQGLDCSWQVLLRVQTLQRLGRSEAAAQLGRSWLAGIDAGEGPAADAEAVALLRQAAGG